MDDLRFTNIGTFQGLTMSTMQTVTLQGLSFPDPQSNLDVQIQSQLDGQIQANLDNTFKDNEQWAVTSPSGTLSLFRDSLHRYAAVMQFTISGSGLIQEDRRRDEC